MKIIPTEVTKLSSGKSTKNGKTHDWVLSRIKIDGDDREFTTFEDFNGKEGQEIEVEIKEEDYQGKQQWKIYLPKRNVWDAIKALEDRLDKLEKLESVPEIPTVNQGDNGVEPENVFGE